MLGNFITNYKIAEVRECPSLYTNVGTSPLAGMMYFDSHGNDHTDSSCKDGTVSFGKCHTDVLRTCRTDPSLYLPYWPSPVSAILAFSCICHTGLLLYLPYWLSLVLDIPQYSYPNTRSFVTSSLVGPHCPIY